MKNNLGSLIFLFLPIYLFSAPLCDIKANIDKNELFVNEETILSIKVKQLDQQGAMFFEFIKPNIDGVKLTLINKKEKKDENQTKIVTFNYKLKATKSTKLELPISIKVKQASYESVNSFNTGSADELENLKTQDSIIKSSPLKIDIKNLKKDVQLIGDFKLVYKFDKVKAKAYEPIYASYDIKGTGTSKDIKTLIKNIKDIDIFLDKRGKLGFDYVFISDKNFSIAPIKISCYSPDKNRYYTLSTVKKDIIITKDTPENILDSDESYPTKSYDLNKLLTFLNAILLFIAGYISAKFDLFKIGKKIKIQHPFEIKVRKCKNEKELLKLLLSLDSDKYKDEITKLEDMIYNHKNHSFKKIKERVLNLYKSF